jgi:uncharacterized membrane protein
MFKSKTIWFAIFLAVAGILEQSQAVITQFVGQQNTGLVMLVISIVVAILRIVTTQPLNAK